MTPLISAMALGQGIPNTEHDKMMATGSLSV